MPLLAVEGDGASAELLRINLPVDDSCDLLAVVGSSTSPELGLLLRASPYQRPSRSSDVKSAHAFSRTLAAHASDETVTEAVFTPVFTPPGVTARLQPRKRAAIAHVHRPRRAVNAPASAASSSHASPRQGAGAIRETALGRCKTPPNAPLSRGDRTRPG